MRRALACANRVRCGYRPGESYEPTWRILLLMLFGAGAAVGLASYMIGQPRRRLSQFHPPLAGVRAVPVTEGRPKPRRAIGVGIGIGFSGRSTRHGQGCGSTPADRCRVHRGPGGRDTRVVMFLHKSTSDHSGHNSRRHSHKQRTRRRWPMRASIWIARDTARSGRGGSKQSLDTQRDRGRARGATIEVDQEAIELAAAQSNYRQSTAPLSGRTRNSGLSIGGPVVHAL